MSHSSLILHASVKNIPLAKIVEKAIAFTIVFVLDKQKIFTIVNRTIPCYNNLCDKDHGPLVKRLRHRPLTAVTGVRVPYGSPKGTVSKEGENLILDSPFNVRQRLSPNQKLAILMVMQLTSLFLWAISTGLYKFAGKGR